MDIITSLQNERVKLTRGLQERPRTRRKHMRIAVEGARLVRDAWERGSRPDFVLYTPGDSDEALVAKMTKARVTTLAVSAEVMQHVSDTQSPQGIIGVFPLPMPPLPKHPRHVLICDALGDPGNLGGLLRSAAAAGADLAILAPGCADPYNPKALRAGMGAHFRLPVVEATWVEIAGYCEPLTLYAADAEGEAAYDAVDWLKPWGLIVGSEAHGLSADAANLAAKQIAIPMSAATESLNAMVAASIILFEAARQTRANDSAG
ncbi:MAG: RNA methyltransferase [Chloroflexi bacterium]|nr:RNA methyltransferase [Chloroflexota bacterium]